MGIRSPAAWWASAWGCWEWRSFCFFLYAIRKSWKWLSKAGNSRHWLNFHVILGVLAPVVITFHSSFKFRGLAGIAYWIMIAVALSGFIGRYIYAQIPRSLKAAFRTVSRPAVSLSWPAL